MASWKEIDRIRKEPKAFRALAKGLRAQFSDDLTDWERDFLEAIAGRDGKEEFTTRQSEKLLQIRDDYTSVSQLPGGFSVRIVLEECKPGSICQKMTSSGFCKAMSGARARSGARMPVGSCGARGNYT
jgi:hypothetical protein